MIPIFSYYLTVLARGGAFLPFLSFIPTCCVLQYISYRVIAPLAFLLLETVDAFIFHLGCLTLLPIQLRYLNGLNLVKENPRDSLSPRGLLSLVSKAWSTYRSLNTT